jgi:hypothetical protein
VAGTWQEYLVADTRRLRPVPDHLSDSSAGQLAVNPRGLATCVQVSIAGYPNIVREQLKIPEELTILCGLAIGYADMDFAANNLRVGRDASASRSCSSTNSASGIRRHLRCGEPREASN